MEAAHVVYTYQMRQYHCLEHVVRSPRVAGGLPQAATQASGFSDVHSLVNLPHLLTVVQRFCLPQGMRHNSRTPSSILSTRLLYTHHLPLIPPNLP